MEPFFLPIVCSLSTPSFASMSSTYARCGYGSEIMNTNHLYDRLSVLPLSDKLLACDGAWNSLYSRDSIRTLCELWVATPQPR